MPKEKAEAYVNAKMGELREKGYAGDDDIISAARNGVNSVTYENVYEPVDEARDTALSQAVVFMNSQNFETNSLKELVNATVEVAKGFERYLRGE
jgi:hypothetical protein